MNTKIIFSDVESGYDGKFKRIFINKEEPLIIFTDKCFSFGVQKNDKFGSTGYSIPIVMYDRTCPTDAQKEFVKVFDDTVKKCKDHLIEHRESIEKYDLELSDLKKFGSCMYVKKNLGKVVENSSPVLYLKLSPNSSLYDLEPGTGVSPTDYLNTLCNIKAAVKIESIFIGNTISLQVKLYEANVNKIQSRKQQRLLCKV